MSYDRYIYLVYTRYTTNVIQEAYTKNRFWGTGLVYTRYIPCNLKLGDPIRSRIAIEMQRHTVFGLQGSSMLSAERGGATAAWRHPSARPSPGDAGCKVTPPTSESAVVAGLRRRRPRLRRRGQATAADDDVVGGSRGPLLTQVAAKLRRRRRLWWYRATAADAHQVKPTMTKRKYCRGQKRMPLAQSTGWHEMNYGICQLKIGENNLFL
jgi:hypothetical protein